MPSLQTLIVAAAVVTAIGQPFIPPWFTGNIRREVSSRSGQFQNSFDGRPAQYRAVGNPYVHQQRQSEQALLPNTVAESKKFDSVPSGYGPPPPLTNAPDANRFGQPYSYGTPQQNTQPVAPLQSQVLPSSYGGSLQPAPNYGQQQTPGFRQQPQTLSPPPGQLIVGQSLRPFKPPIDQPYYVPYGLLPAAAATPGTPSPINDGFVPYGLPPPTVKPSILTPPPSVPTSSYLPSASTQGLGLTPSNGGYQVPETTPKPSSQTGITTVYVGTTPATTLIAVSGITTGQTPVTAIGTTPSGVLVTVVQTRGQDATPSQPAPVNPYDIPTAPQSVTVSTSTGSTPLTVTTPLLSSSITPGILTPQTVPTLLSTSAGSSVSPSASSPILSSPTTTAPESQPKTVPALPTTQSSPPATAFSRSTEGIPYSIPPIQGSSTIQTSLPTSSGTNFISSSTASTPRVLTVESVPSSQPTSTSGPFSSTGQSTISSSQTTTAPSSYGTGQTPPTGQTISVSITPSSIAQTSSSLITSTNPYSPSGGTGTTATPPSPTAITQSSVLSSSPGVPTVPSRSEPQTTSRTNETPSSSLSSTRRGELTTTEVPPATTTTNVQNAVTSTTAPPSLTSSISIATPTTLTTGTSAKETTLPNSSPSSTLPITPPLGTTPQEISSKSTPASPSATQSSRTSVISVASTGIVSKSTQPSLASTPSGTTVIAVASTGTVSESTQPSLASTPSGTIGFTPQSTAAFTGSTSEVSSVPTIHARKTTQPGKPVPNSISGKPHLFCNADGITFTARTRQPFTGRIFSKGHESIDECTRQFQQPTPSLNLTFNYIKCGTVLSTNLRTNETMYGIELVMVFQTSGQPENVATYLAQCMHQKIEYNIEEMPTLIEEAAEELNITPVFIERRAIMPQCMMRVVPENEEDLHHYGPSDKQPVRLVNIGDKLRIEWTLNPVSIAYGFIITNCTVEDEISGHKHQVIDDKGCSTDLNILAHPHYDIYHDLAIVHWHAFKVPDNMILSFKCSCRVCNDVRDDDGSSSCETIPTPPFCPKFDLIETHQNSVLFDFARDFSARNLVQNQPVQAEVRVFETVPQPTALPKTKAKAHSNATTWVRHESKSSTVATAPKRSSIAEAATFANSDSLLSSLNVTVSRMTTNLAVQMCMSRGLFIALITFMILFTVLALAFCVASMAVYRRSRSNSCAALNVSIASAYTLSPSKVSPPQLSRISSGDEYVPHSRTLQSYRPADLQQFHRVRSATRTDASIAPQQRHPLQSRVAFGELSVHDDSLLKPVVHRNFCWPNQPNRVRS